MALLVVHSCHKNADRIVNTYANQIARLTYRTNYNFPPLNRFTALEEVHLHLPIGHVKFAADVRHVDINGCGALSLVVPRACSYLDCGYNGVSSLTLDGEFTYVNCANNSLKSIKTTGYIGELNCNWNYRPFQGVLDGLRELVLPYGCGKLYCSHNNMQRLVVKTTCTYVNCADGNDLKYVEVPPNCKYLDCGMCDVIVAPHGCEVVCINENRIRWY